MFQKRFNRNNDNGDYDEKIQNNASTDTSTLTARTNDGL